MVIFLLLNYFETIKKISSKYVQKIGLGGKITKNVKQKSCLEFDSFVYGPSILNIQERSKNIGFSIIFQK